MLVAVVDALQQTIICGVAIDAVVGAQIESSVLVGGKSMNSSHGRSLGLHLGGTVVEVQAQQAGVVGQP